MSLKGTVSSQKKERGGIFSPLGIDTTVSVGTKGHFPIKKILKVPLARTDYQLKSRLGI